MHTSLAPTPHFHRVHLIQPVKHTTACQQQITPTITKYEEKQNTE
jgi:hypothetical protein